MTLILNTHVRLLLSFGAGFPACETRHAVQAPRHDSLAGAGAWTHFKLKPVLTSLVHGNLVRCQPDLNRIDKQPRRFTSELCMHASSNRLQHPT